MKRAFASRIALLFGIWLWHCVGFSVARADDWRWGLLAFSSNANWSNSGNWYFAGDTSQNSYAPDNDGSADIFFSNVPPFGNSSLVSNVDANWAINSLHFDAGPAYVLSGNQLTIGAGGILTSNSSSGPTINTPILLAAPQTWMATSTLSMTVGGTVNTNSQKLTLDGGGSVNINGAITGSGQIILNGTGTVTFGGNAANTFSGPIQVNNGTLYLDKPNVANATVGNLTIGAAGGGPVAFVELLAPNQIGDSSTVTINSSGILWIPNGSQEYIPTLVLNGGWATTDTGQGCFLGFINNMGTVATNASSTTANITGVLNLNDDSSHFTTFSVASGTTQSGIDLAIAAAVVAGGMTKNGAGTMLLSGSNTFAGGVNLNAGTIFLGSDTVGSSGSITSGPAGTGVLYLSDQTTIEAHGNHTIANFISIPTTGTSGIIDGPSNLTLTGGLTGNGSLVKNGTGTLTFNAATSRAIGGGLTINNGSVVLNIGTAAGLTINGNLAVGAVSGQTATLSVNNANFVQNGATNVIVGATGSGAATVNVGTTANGTLTVGSGGLIVNPTGAVHIGSTTTSGTLDMTTHAGNITINGGSLEIDGGLITFPFATTSTVHIENGGTLTTAVSIPTAIFGDGTTSTINVTGNNVTLGTNNGLVFLGFNHQGVLNINTHIVTLASNSYAQLGSFTYLNGGTINASNGISLPSGSWLVGGGSVNGRVVGEPGAIISVSLSQTLEMGDSTSPAGFNYGGELRMIAGGAMTLDSSGPATLGNLTTLDAGTLNATNGFVLNFGDAISGRGTVNSSNTLALHSVVNGIVQGNSASQPITLSGWIKGTGTLNNVSFAPGATYDPGFSPATVNVGSIAFTAGSALNIDIGGTSPGSQYDQIISSGTPALAGTLNLVPYGGFIPVAGDKFTVMTYAGSSGTFSTIIGTSPAPGLTYSVIYEPTSLVILTTANGCKTWGVDSDGKLSSGNNFIGSAAPNGIGAVATFSNIITANRTVTVDADTTLGTLNFDSPFNYTLGGPHKLTMQAAGSAAAQINVSAAHGNGSHTISVPLEMASDLNISQNLAKPLNIAGGLQDPLGKALSTSGSGQVTVSGPVTFGNGTTLAVKGNGSLRMQLTSGTPVSVGAAVQAQVNDSATLELAGSASALSSGSARADIKNNSAAKAGVHVTGINQQVGGIEGTGNTAVEAGADLTASHILQNALVIGGQPGLPGKATVAASDPLGRPLTDVLSDPNSSGLILANSLSPNGPFAAADVSARILSSPVVNRTDPVLLSRENPIEKGIGSSVPEPPTLLLALVAILGGVGAQHARRPFRSQTS